MRAWNFYAGTGTDHRGRTSKEILAWEDDTLENEHDFIQWLFPLEEQSGVNPAAPLLTVDEMQRFQQSPEVQTRIVEALRRMLAFYGLQMSEADGAVRIVQAVNYPARRANWVTRGNHNFLRVTRILKSLCLLGLSRHAAAFFECLVQIFTEEHEMIGANTFAYWRRAVQ